MKKIQRELKDIETNPPADFTAGVSSGGDLFHWSAMIFGPAGTPYQGGAFELDIHFPADYPFKAPTVKFVTKVYHCNVGADGNICLGIIKGALHIFQYTIIFLRLNQK
jgi:ubiquitin-conjugating enzyme E2 D/E